MIIQYKALSNCLANLIYILCLSLVTKSVAQDFKFGKVSKKEFYTEVNEFSEAAIYLQNYRETKFDYEGRDDKGWFLITTIKERLKIENKQGLDYATNKVQLYKDNDKKESISKLKGYTYNLVNGKVLKTKLENEAIFEIDNSENWNEVKWTMPNVKTGSIIEWEYTITSPFLKIDDLILQKDIPIKNLEAVISIPSFFNYKMVRRGFFEIQPEQSFKKRFLNILQDQNLGYGYTSKVAKTKSTTISFNELKSIFKRQNVPALKIEVFVKNINNYKHRLSFELESFQFPNQQKKYYTKDWNDVANQLFKAKNFGKRLEKVNYLENEVKKISVLKLPYRQRLTNAFNAIKNNMFWNGKSSIFANKALSSAFKDKTGNVAEINLILISLLKELGFNAYPVLVSTKKHGKPVFTTIDGYNYIIVAVSLGNKLYLMDATEKKSAINVLPYRARHWTGKLIRDNGTSESINLEKFNTEKSFTSLSYSISDKGDISGQLKKRYSSIESLRLRNNYDHLSLKNSLRIQNHYNAELNIKFTEILDYKIYNKPIVESFDFQVNNKVERIQEKLFFSPLLFIQEHENPFKLDSRQYPIEFDYPILERKSITINIPENYTTEYLPESTILKLPNNLGEYNFNCGIYNKTIKINTKLKLTNNIDKPLYYSLKEFYQRLVNIEKARIILKKL